MSWKNSLQRGLIHMNLIKVNDYEEMSQTVCKIISEKLTELSSPVLGLATGSTPQRLYELLVDEYKQGKISFANTHTVNLDEYVGLDSTDPNSYRYYMDTILFDHIDIPKHQAHIPNGAATDLQKECEDYEAIIRSAGGVDLQLLGIGLNGHIGFNEPGTSFTSRTHVVALDESTREANARFFNSIDDVPTQAITMGIDSIFESKEIVLMISGEKKAEALYKLINGDVTEDFPASILQNHENVTVVADKAALSLLQTKQDSQ